MGDTLEKQILTEQSFEFCDKCGEEYLEGYIHSCRPSDGRQSRQQTDVKKAKQRARERNKPRRGRKIEDSFGIRW